MKKIYNQAITSIHRQRISLFCLCQHPRVKGGHQWIKKIGESVIEVGGQEHAQDTTQYNRYSTIDIEQYSTIDITIDIVQ